MNKEQLGKEAFDLHKKISENEIMRRKLLAENAKSLNRMISEGLYKIFLGDDEAKPIAYYSQLDVFYTRNQITRLIAIEEIFSKKFGLNVFEVFDIPDSRLSDIVSVATEDNITELLDWARTMLSKDWKEEVRKLKKLPIPENCKKHDYEHYAICKSCGEKTKESK